MSDGLPIFTELVERCATPGGMTAILKARLGGATFKPIAMVFVRCGRFVAEIEFEQPINIEQQSAIAVMLDVVPERVAA